jgi:hypothetical protein
VFHSEGGPQNHARVEHQLGRNALQGLRDFEPAGLGNGPDDDVWRLVDSSCQISMTLGTPLMNAVPLLSPSPNRINPSDDRD